MLPAIAPLGLDYIAAAAKQSGIDMDVLDLCLADEPDATLKEYFLNHSPALVGLSFRNVDDCFWPSCRWFVPTLADTIKKLRSTTEAPIVVGGVGFSIFAEQIVEYTGADFGIRGDGEQAICSLYNQLRTDKRFDRVPGLVWRNNDTLRANKPAWPENLSLPTGRNTIDNAAYLQRGGQCGLETKRGCNQKCIYCADPLAKGTSLRLRPPAEVADEAESLAEQRIDMLHICDSEFNIPRSHALAVCEEFIRRRLGKRLRWYTYMAVVPFDAELAKAMRVAGCVGIDFTGDAACPPILKNLRQNHTKEDLAATVQICKDNGITVMIDLLLGGPGETPQTARETIDFIKQIAPDAAGAPLGVRVYPHTEMADILAKEGPPESNPNICRKYDGKVDLFQPSFYISKALGEKPAALIKDIIAGDTRFFEPAEDMSDTSKDHNYNDNTELVNAIAAGARGAYWDILRKLRNP